MRRGLAVCLAAALAACGSDDDDNGGNPSASVSVTGANTFTATSAIGYSTPSPVSCSVAGIPVPVSTSIIAIFMTDTAGDTCALVNANQEKRGAGAVGIVIARGNVLGGTPPPLAPSTYQITSSDLPDPDLQGNATFVSAFAAKNPPGACGAADVEAEDGTVTITSINGGVISGSIDAALQGGGRIVGTFTSAACALSSADVCSEIIDDSPDACVD